MGLKDTYSGLSYKGLKLSYMRLKLNYMRLEPGLYWTKTEFYGT